MANPPIQYFRKEDFPELANQSWAQKLFTKLNGMARQTQYTLSGNVSVENNFSGFWWSGSINVIKKDESVIYPFTETAPATVTVRNATSIRAFPFEIVNKLIPKTVKAVLVAQAWDVTDLGKKPLPALVGGVAWGLEGDKVRIHAINGMLVGRNYNATLLIIGE